MDLQDIPISHTIVYELTWLTMTPALVTLAWIVFILTKTDFSSVGMTLTTAAVSVLRAERHPRERKTSTKTLTTRFVIASVLTTITVLICGTSSVLDGPTTPLPQKKPDTSSWFRTTTSKPVNYYNSLIFCYFGILGVIATITSFDYLLELISRMNIQNISTIWKPQPQLESLIVHDTSRLD